MTRIDWIVLRRLSGRVGLTIAVFFGLFALVESLDTWRFQALSKIGGPLLAILAIVSNAGRSVIGTLAVTVLIGVIIGVLDLQARRELTVIKAAGRSIWQVMRAPLLAAFLLGVGAALLADTLAIEINRALPVSGSRSGALWLEQRGADGAYILMAEHPLTGGAVLDDVRIYMTDDPGRQRIEAATATLVPGAWALTGAVRYRPDTAPETLPDGFELPTLTTVGDMQVRLTSTRDLTVTELLSAVSRQLADPALRSSALTSLFRLAALPVLLCASVLIGFAFTSGYRRTNKYGGAVLYGVVLGFVVYVVTELSNRSGFAGVLDPALAAAGPAIVAIVIGLTVLLYKEDGRA